MDIFDKLKEYQVEPVKKIMRNARTAKPNGIVFFGDSIIQGFDIKKYFSKENLYNCGCNGATSDTLLHLQPFAVNDYKPSKVILMVGTNDLSDEWQFDKLEIAFNIYKLINIMRNYNPAVDVVVISPLPIIENEQKGICKDNVQLKLLGNEIKANVEEFVGTVYVDMYSHFLDDNKQLKQDFTSDGLHLNEAGYDLFANLIKEYI
ncbi:MAG: GDSL-type esterase/lipase family protein [Bacilli bacterium]|nr:GDSL-type esterase/lipase family protein [Bacilli bacterium]